MWNLLLYRVAPVICILVNGACIGRLYGFTPAAVFWWVLFWICGSAIHMALHETGHLLGGLCSGYKLVFCQVGPLRLASSGDGKLSLRVRRDRSGQCVMAPASLQRIRYIRYNAGGILVNLLVCAGALPLCRAVPGYGGFFFLQLFFAGLPKLYTNCIPCLSGGCPTDAYILRLLTGNPACRRDYGTYLYVYARRFWGLPVRRQDYTYERTEEGKKAERIYYDALQELLEESEGEKDG